MDSDIHNKKIKAEIVIPNILVRKVQGTFPGYREICFINIFIPDPYHQEVGCPLRIKTDRSANSKSLHPWMIFQERTWVVDDLNTRDFSLT